MKASERLEIIIDEVQTNGIVRVAEISGRLGCSEVTIRNDIRKLDQQGVLKENIRGSGPQGKRTLGGIHSRRIFPKQ